MENKKCSKCGLDLLLSDFSKRSDRDAYMSWCKSCECARSKEKYLKNIEQHKEAHRKWKVANATRYREQQKEYYAANRELFRLKHNKWYKNHLEQKRTHGAVRIALRNNKLSKASCSKCGSDRFVQAHHEDYSRPINVVWLCKKCHMKRHLQLSNEKYAA